MGLRSDLDAEVASVFAYNWQVRNGTVVPEAESVGLQNDAVRITATVLYSDLASSTTLVNTRKQHFAAEVYKAFLHCAAKIIRNEGGSIAAYDGDRIMAVFIGGGMEASAVRAALKLRFAVTDIISPALRRQYPNDGYEIRFGSGIDRSELFVARTGIRGSNDLVWVGRAANYAARLSELREWPACTYVTDAIHSKLPENLQSPGGAKMWESRSWTELAGVSLFRTGFQIAF